MKVLITGICGFVGSTLAKAWRQRDPSIVIYGLDNFSRPGSEQNRKPLAELGVQLFHGDIRMAADFEVLPPVDWVIDAAANPSVLAGIDGRTSSRQLVEYNLGGTINLLEYCKRTKAGFILLSTSRVYSIASLCNVAVTATDGAFQLQSGQLLPEGLSAAGVDESFSTAPPISLYGSTKRASEVLALEYGETFGLPVFINRCGVLGGAGQFGRADQGIFAFWVHAWRQRRPLTYLGFGGKGHQVRDCLHPRDLLPLLEQQLTVENRHRPRIINLGGGTGNAMSLAELSAWCTERFGPHNVGAIDQNRPFDIPWLVMDSSLAQQTWNWQPQTSLESILDEIALHAEQNPNWLEISQDP